MRNKIDLALKPKSPARFYRFISEEVAPYLRERHKKPLLRQIREMLAMRREYRFLPYHYVTHELYRSDLAADVLDYLPADMMVAFCNSLNPRESVGAALDKALFGRTMREAGLAALDYFCILRSSGELRDFSGARIRFAQLLESLRGRHREVFAKVRTGSCGFAAFRLAVADVERMGLDGLLSFLYGKPDVQPTHEFLLQRVIVQHPLLASIASSSVNTVRIDTLLDGDAVSFNTAVLRVGSGLQCTDNWATGGLIVRIELDSGTLRGNGKAKSKYGKRQFAAHPVTGARFDGIVLPFWDELKALVASAARVMLPLRSLGWDVALTPDGPLLIEVNHDYDIFLSQHAGGGYRGTPFGRALLRRHPRHPLPP
jgi:hypothetical protein